MSKGSLVVAESRPRRRWYQFTLRTLLLITTLFCIALATWQTLVAPYRLQRSAAERLAAFSGQTGNRTPSAPFGSAIEFEPALPTWLRWLPHSSDLIKVTTVRIDHCDATDKDFECLRDLPHIERLYLPATEAGDKTLNTVAGLRHLRRLSLWRTKVTSAGVKRLGNLPQLEALDIQECSVDEDVLEPLGKLPKLAIFRHNIALSDAGLDRLSRFPSLTECGNGQLVLNDVTDHGMEQLGWFSGITLLSATKCRLSSAGWARLAKFPEIWWVELYDSDLEAVAADALGSLPRLTHLKIYQSKASGNWRCIGRWLSESPEALLESEDTSWTLESLRCIRVPRGRVRVYSAQFNRCPGVTLESAGQAWGDTIVAGGIGEDDFWMDGFSVRGPVIAADLASIERFSDLIELTIERRDLSQAVTKLHGLKKLARLSLTGPISDEVLAQVAKLKTLRRLTIVDKGEKNGPSISLAGLRQIASLPSIQSLKLSCNLSAEMREFLRSVQWLKALDVEEIEQPQSN